MFVYAITYPKIMSGLNFNIIQAKARYTFCQLPIDSTDTCDAIKTKRLEAFSNIYVPSISFGGKTGHRHGDYCTRKGSATAGTVQVSI